MVLAAEKRRSRRGAKEMVIDPRMAGPLLTAAQEKDLVSSLRHVVGLKSIETRQLREEAQTYEMLRQFGIPKSHRTMVYR